jgi:hypothetical protein
MKNFMSNNMPLGYREFLQRCLSLFGFISASKALQ